MYCVTLKRPKNAANNILCVPLYDFVCVCNVMYIRFLHKSFTTRITTLVDFVHWPHVIVDFVAHRI